MNDQDLPSSRPDEITDNSTHTSETTIGAAARDALDRELLLENLSHAKALAAAVARRNDELRILKTVQINAAARHATIAMAKRHASMSPRDSEASRMAYLDTRDAEIRAAHSERAARAERVTRRIADLDAQAAALKTQSGVLLREGYDSLDSNPAVRKLLADELSAQAALKDEPRRAPLQPMSAQVRRGLG